VSRRRAAIVTGASRGIGRAVAIALAEDGLDVALLARSQTALEEVAAECAGHGARAVPIGVDVTDEASVARAVAAAVDQLGGIDVLVNNAGVDLERRIVDTTLEEWRHVMAVNLDAAFLMLREAGPHLFAAEHPRVINTSSIFALAGASKWSAYSAAKAGLLALTRTLAVEWARHGVRVNAVVPGNVETEMTAEALADPALRAYAEGRTPTRRIGIPSDIAPAVCFLAGTGSEFITGTALTVDGGFLAW
jgi:2-deoxy-D-gluconate 3-dehydrogenase